MHKKLVKIISSKKVIHKKTASYLSSIFPGPGSVAGPTQAVVLAIVSSILDPKYKFDRKEFLKSVPLSPISPDIWNAAMTLFGDLANKNNFGLGASAIGVATADLLAELAQNALTNKVFNHKNPAPHPALNNPTVKATQEQSQYPNANSYRAAQSGITQVLGQNGSPIYGIASAQPTSLAYNAQLNDNTMQTAQWEMPQAAPGGGYRN